MRSDQEGKDRTAGNDISYLFEKLSKRDENLALGGL